MSNWLMNRLFKAQAFYSFSKWNTMLSAHLSTEGAQQTMAHDLMARE